jgi:hypothetical protein
MHYYYTNIYSMTKNKSNKLDSAIKFRWCNKIDRFNKLMVTPINNIKIKS